MFGYIKPYFPELKVRENELYKAVYCGLCKSMGTVTKAFSRLTLSYDMVFLALVISSLEGEKFKIVKGRCGVNPLRKKRPVASDNGILKYCSAVSANLTYYSMLDKKADEKGFKKLGSSVALPFCRRMKKRAKKIFEFDDAYIESLISKIHENEKNKAPSIDDNCGLTGKMLAYYFSCGVSSGKKASAEKIGLNTGKFIYAADALDDYGKDKKSGAYNPLIFAECGFDEALAGVRFAMSMWSDAAAGELTLEGADLHETDIAVNITRLGMIHTMEKLTEKNKKENGISDVH